jgi:tRNA/tmRNA/rRNA uracil-C5-methylase (TrmA/RlmC/RlmD family)
VRPPREIGPPVGETWELEIERTAAGGACVARHEGRVVFVRHTLPGELVRAVVTEAAKKFARADAVEVLRASPDRVEPPCPVARPGECGGCDFQHASLPSQRSMKAEQVAEQLRRVAGWDTDVLVEEVPGAPDGLRWRTRERFAVDASGRAGLRAARSHRVVEIDDCLIAAQPIIASGVLATPHQGATELRLTVGSEGPAVVEVDVDEETPTSRVVQHALGRDWKVATASFWQVHPGAAVTLAQAVLDAVGARPGEHALDLYSGVGLFAAGLAEAVGPGGRIEAVEGAPSAVTDARRNLHDLPQVTLHDADVLRWLRAGTVKRCDIVVLDPPRTGLGEDGTARVLDLHPRVVAYMSCDAATLARDLKVALTRGWRVTTLRAFDCFPMTQHVEVLAVLEPPLDGADDGSDPVAVVD